VVVALEPQQEVAVAVLEPLIKVLLVVRKHKQCKWWRRRRCGCGWN
jgi:hypothetical protein